LFARVFLFFEYRFYRNAGDYEILKNFARPARNPDDSLRSFIND